MYGVFLVLHRQRLTILLFLIKILRLADPAMGRLTNLFKPINQIINTLWENLKT
jgi:hypothetical protein